MILIQQLAFDWCGVEGSISIADNYLSSAGQNQTIDFLLALLILYYFYSFLHNLFYIIDIASKY